MKYLFAAIILLYNILLIVGTAYIVFGLGFSGWWFLLTIILMATVKIG